MVQQLAPVPPGYDYVRVDNDVLLMDMTNRMVADVVNDINDYDCLDRSFDALSAGSGACR